MVKNNSNKKDDNSNYIFLAFLFIGIALGFLYSNVVVGALFGLGIGFLAKFIILQNMKK